MAYATSIRKGNVIKFNDKLFSVFSFQHTAPGKGKAFVQVKLRNIETGIMITHKFFSNEKIEFVRLEERIMQYIYEDEEKYYFMNVENYEQIFLTREQLEDYIDFLIPDIQFQVYFYNDVPVTAELPQKVNLKVTQTEPGVKGDTVSNTTKPAVLESGLEINVPLFINENDIISVDTKTKQYLERVEKAK